MAGIQRFITYIYAYEEGKKGANKGFAKVEVRGSECRMEIHIWDIRKSCVMGEVFLFREKEGMLESILIGELKLVEGRGDSGLVIKTERIRETEYSFRDMEGVMLLMDDQTICLSRWKEGRAMDVRLARVKRLEEKVWEEERKTKKESELPKAVQQKTDAPQESGLVSESQAAMKEQEPQSAAEAETEEGKAMQTDSIWQDDIQATEVPMKNIFPQYEWRKVWENLKNTYPSFVIYQEKEILCVRIELKDLRELPQKYWYFGNNSFLLHGFFNYRHLIIGSLEEDRWFIGVPGIYQPQERVMAAIFGFTEFLPQEKAAEEKEDTCQKLQEHLINQFGYWYHVF